MILVGHERSDEDQAEAVRRLGRGARRAEGGGRQADARDRGGDSTGRGWIAPLQMGAADVGADAAPAHDPPGAPVLDQAADPVRERPDADGERIANQLEHQRLALAAGKARRVPPCD
jgi:hypothetical protein